MNIPYLEPKRLLSCNACVTFCSGLCPTAAERPTRWRCRCFFLRPHGLGKMGTSTTSIIRAQHSSVPGCCLPRALPYGRWASRSCSSLRCGADDLRSTASRDPLGLAIAQAIAVSFRWRGRCFFLRPHGLGKSGTSTTSIIRAQRSSLPGLPLGRCWVGSATQLHEGKFHGATHRRF